MDCIGTFPFGNPVMPVVQLDTTPKLIFILGVYASAVHARWIGADDRQKIAAVAVASEPEIFWRGSQESAESIINEINLPAKAGRLEPASPQLNGPSGTALDKLFLAPLRLTRQQAWLCDLVPHSCMNPCQETALRRAFDPERAELGLEEYKWPSVPDELANDARRKEILDELQTSGAEILMTLGDEPLKWFASHFGGKKKLSAYGQSPSEYGQLHEITIGGRSLRILPLVHPRQAARLGRHSKVWAAAHKEWVLSDKPRSLIES